MAPMMRGGRRSRWFFEAIVALVALVCLVGIATYWVSSQLTRPVSEVGTIRLGVQSPNPDTRVFFNFDEWTTHDRPTLRIVLGQSSSDVPGVAQYRIEFNGFLAPVNAATCPGLSTASTCYSGDGTLSESEGVASVVFEGEFESTGFFAIDATPTSASGAASRGPYRSAFYEFLELDVDEDSILPFPAGGVEVEFSTGVGQRQVLYESIFPDQPYRIYPDGWAFLIEPPGGVSGAQFTILDAERGRVVRSEVALLVMGVLLALFIQATFEGVKDFLESTAAAG